MKKDELKRNSHPHITDGGELIKTMMKIVEDNHMGREIDQYTNVLRLKLEKKFGKPRSKYHR